MRYLHARIATAAITLAAVSACGSVGYVASELTGSVKPDGGIAEAILTSRTFDASADAIRVAVLNVLQDQGYIYEENRSAGTVRTEPKPLPNVGGMAGASFSTRAFINLDGQNVTYRARFDKRSNVVMAETNIEYTEKENELRRDFFAAVTKRLAK